MNILIVGVSGFIGHHLYKALSQDGHNLTGCSRHEVNDINWKKFNFQQSQEQWLGQLQNIDIVINAAGIYQQTVKDEFSQTHDLGPKVLFDACKQCNIRLIQISAIGAEKNKPVTKFLQSKRNADQYLLAQKQSDIVLYPGVVLGEQGRTTRQLTLLAHLYCIPLVFGQNKTLPLVSIYQLTEFIMGIINNWPETSLTKVLIAQPETMEHLFNNLRHWVGLEKGCFIALPEQLSKLIFSLFPQLSIGAFNKQSMTILADYSDKTPQIRNVFQESASESLLRHTAAKHLKKELRITMLFYINLFVLGLIWFVSGLSSIINFDQSHELLALSGINTDFNDAIIISAASADIFLGLLLWAGLYYQRLRKTVIYTQMVIMIIYSIIISLTMPIFWLHPFAPIIKNLAVLLLAMYLLNEKDKIYYV